MTQDAQLHSVKPTVPSITIDLGVEVANTGGVQLIGRKIRDSSAFKLGKLGEGTVSLYLATANPRIAPFTVNGKKDVVSLTADPIAETGNARVYKRNITVHFAPPSLYYTRYPDNHIKILEIAKDGSLEVWEIAVISQQGEFYLTVQLLYQAELYKGDGLGLGTVAIPAFDTKWPQLAEFIRNTLGLKPALITKQKDEKREDFSVGLTPGEGRVVWYNAANGVGAIVLSDGSQARVHWTEAPARALDRKYLVKGEKVAYSALQTPDTKPNQRQTGFQEEAIGVTLIES